MIFVPKLAAVKMDYTTGREAIGKGRSGTVYRSSDNRGNILAIKVFSGSDSLTKFVNYVLTGAPNPYSWNEHAVQCAHLRREILTVLIPGWFGPHLKIARSYGTAWNNEFKAYEIVTEFITGRQVSLHHPFSSETEGEYDDLCRQVMEPLQKKLIASGFDGLVWQAGKGNPVALNNFLLDQEGNWVWIDAESGVPAIFPLNPLSLLFFYIPKAFKYRHLLFDDVNTGKLHRYVDENQDQFKEEEFIRLKEAIRQLEKQQDEWWSIGRARKSITYKLKKGKITESQANWYNRHIMLWYGKELAGFLKNGLISMVVKLPLWIIRKLMSINLWEIIKNIYKFLFTREYRKYSIEKYLNKRINEWEKRGQLNPGQADFLRDQAKHESASPYLADFIIVLGLKPVTQVIELVVLPSLYATGLISIGFLAVGAALGGSIYRTIYTLGKMLYEQFRFPESERHPRMIALVLGLIPTVGNAAYPIQMIYSVTTRKKELAEFLTYDLASNIGERIPVWGGRDTKTEHFFNRIPDFVIKKRDDLKNCCRKTK